LLICGRLAIGLPNRSMRLPPREGGGLSGGRRQRLTITRAIASRPRVLLFDEATSALDNQTQAVVSRSLEALDARRIVIAHRLSTIVKADRIFVLEAGTVGGVGKIESVAATTNRAIGASGVGR